MARNKAEIDSSTVIHAVHTLRERENGRAAHGDERWPTAERIADFLEVPVADVRRLLNGLRRKRIFDHRQRRGERVWMPWERCH